MSTVEKALALLRFFDEERTELGLSELRRLSKRDKATTYRYLAALESAGLLERAGEGPKYCIGPAVLRLARLRERSMPRLSVVGSVLSDLAAATGETSHAAQLEGARLTTLDHRESSAHGTRVKIDISDLPLHATASGLAAVAFGPAQLRAAALDGLHRFTADTAATPAALEQAIAEARHTGIAETAGTFEEDVYSFAAPVFGGTGGLAGTLAVAAVQARVGPGNSLTIRRALVAACRETTRRWGGQVPAPVDTLWAATLSQVTEMPA